MNLFPRVAAAVAGIALKEFPSEPAPLDAKLANAERARLTQRTVVRCRTIVG